VIPRSIGEWRSAARFGQYNSPARYVNQTQHQDAGEVNTQARADRPFPPWLRMSGRCSFSMVARGSAWRRLYIRSTPASIDELVPERVRMHTGTPAV
jgi:hypothetical protein